MHPDQIRSGVRVFVRLKKNQPNLLAYTLQGLFFHTYALRMPWYMQQYEIEYTQYRIHFTNFSYDGVVIE